MASLAGVLGVRGVFWSDRGAEGNEGDGSEMPVGFATGELALVVVVDGWMAEAALEATFLRVSMVVVCTGERGMSDRGATTDQMG
jgi:hypothetical protein